MKSSKLWITVKDSSLEWWSNIERREVCCYIVGHIVIHGICRIKVFVRAGTQVENLGKILQETANLNLGKSWQDLGKISQDLSKIFQDLGKIFMKQDLDKILARSYKILQDLARSCKILARCSTWATFNHLLLTGPAYLTMTFSYWARLWNWLKGATGWYVNQSVACMHVHLHSVLYN